MKLKYLIVGVTLLFTLLIVCFCCTILSFIILLNTPGEYWSRTVNSSDNKYSIQLKSVDFGGSYGGCSDKYHLYFTNFDMGCGGVQMRAYLIKNSTKRKVEIKLPKNLPCGPEFPCKELDEFYIRENGNFMWYGTAYSINDYF